MKNGFVKGTITEFPRPAKRVAVDCESRRVAEGVLHNDFRSVALTEKLPVSEPSFSA